MNWRKFQELSKNFRQMQLSLLMSAVPESMDLKGMTGWGKLVSNAIAYAYKVEADATQSEDVQQHWGEVKDHAVLQLERIASSLADFIEEAEELSAWERCQVFSLLSLCSQTFQDESDAIRAAAEALGKSNDVPESVSADTLELLSKFASRSYNE